MPREFTVTREQNLPTTPERVWRAVTTAAGNLGWLYPMEVEPRVGGTVSRADAKVTEWEPMHRFACRATDGTGFSTTLRYLVDQHDGEARLRMGIYWLHEAEPDDGWDTRAYAVEKYVDLYQHSLREYLAHFDGRTATYVTATRDTPARPHEFDAVARGLSLPDTAEAGDSVRLTPHGLEALDGVLDYRDENFIGVRTGNGLYRFFRGDRWNAPTWLAHHLFTANIDGEQVTQHWQAWLNKTTSTAD